ncbi:hypothetical protein [Methylomicrobium agile]|nr:hypothetical protein [Methylomicrobium agile]
MSGNGEAVARPTRLPGYAYVGNNPFNRNDPRGLIAADMKLLAGNFSNEFGATASAFGSAIASRPALQSFAAGSTLGAGLGLATTYPVATAVTLSSFELENLASGEMPVGGVWGLKPLARGQAIENSLASTEYKDWFRIGQLNNGKFPLVDFQLENNLVSLKTVNTNGSSWLGNMQSHIDDLAARGATVDGVPANMILDLRVQPGGSNAAQSLIGYGQSQGVSVMIKEFP